MPQQFDYYRQLEIILYALSARILLHRRAMILRVLLPDTLYTDSVISDILHSLESSHGLIDVSLINHKNFSERIVDFSFEIDSLLNEIKNQNQFTSSLNYE